MQVCKIFTAQEWEVRQHADVIAGTALDLQDGFMHLSFPEQVTGTLARFYRGAGDVVILTLDASRLGNGLKIEEAHGQRFPHLYGPLPRAALLHAEPRAAQALFVEPFQADIDH